MYVLISPLNNRARSVRQFLTAVEPFPCRTSEGDSLTGQRLGVLLGHLTVQYEVVEITNTRLYSATAIFSSCSAFAECEVPVGRWHFTIPDLNRFGVCLQLPNPVPSKRVIYAFSPNVFEFVSSRLSNDHFPGLCINSQPLLPCPPRTKFHPIRLAPIAKNALFFTSASSRRKRSVLNFVVIVSAMSQTPRRLVVTYLRLHDIEKSRHSRRTHRPRCG